LSHTAASLPCNCGDEVSHSVYTPNTIIIGIGNEQSAGPINRKANWLVQDGIRSEPAVPNWASQDRGPVACNDRQHTRNMIDSDNKTLTLQSEVEVLLQVGHNCGGTAQWNLSRQHMIRSTPRDRRDNSDLGRTGQRHAADQHRKTNQQE